MMLCAVVLVLLLSGCASAQRDLPEVRIAPHIAQHLRDVQASFKMETVYCAGGAMTEQLINITWLKLAEFSQQTAGYVRYAGDCDDDDYLGIAHNHPKPFGCTFSRPDLDTFQRSTRARIDIVVGTNCLKVRLRDGREVPVP